MRRPTAINWIVTIVAAILSVVAITVEVTGPDSTTGTPSKITFHVNEQQGDGAPTTKVEVPRSAVEDAEQALEKNLRTTPPETPKSQIKAAAEQADQIRDTKAPLPTAGATQGVPGCVTRFVRNQSSRYSVRPVQQWLHYTVSRNVPGWSDVNAIVALFDRASFRASSNFVIDAEGHCAYIVPIENKSWTQAGANYLAVSYEVINSGSESAYMATAGYAKLRSVMRTVSARTGIPMRRGGVRNCTSTRSGIVQHKDGGICSGGHHDISPFPMEAIVRILISGSAPAKASPLTKDEQVLVRRRCEARSRLAHQRPDDPATLADARAAKARIRTQMVSIQQAARRSGGGGWKARKRGTRYQILGRAYEGSGC